MREREKKGFLGRSDLECPAVSERWDRSLGKSFRQSRLTKKSGGSQEPWDPCSLQSLAGVAHGNYGLRANMALDFKAQHLRPLVSYLLLTGLLGTFSKLPQCPITI